MLILEKIAKRRIKKIIDEWDPEGLLDIGAPDNEYTPEINMIYYGLKIKMKDTVYFTFRFYMESYYEADDAYKWENLKFQEETRYDIFECREIEQRILQRVWWL